MPGRDWAVVSVGVALTTFLCPALSNFALFLISLPAWATPGASALYALPAGVAPEGEPVTWRAVLGRPSQSRGSFQWPSTVLKGRPAPYYKSSVTLLLPVIHTIHK